MAVASSAAPPTLAAGLGFPGCKSVPPCWAGRLPSSRIGARGRGSSYNCPLRGTTMTPIRILLADDHAVLRAGLRLLLNGQPGLEVVGEAADVAEALRQVRALKPDVLTLDLTMPGGSSIKLIERLRQECPE